MVHATKDNGTVTRSRDSVSLNGQTVGDLKAVGSETNFTVAVFTHGQMVEATMGSTSKIRSTDLEYINGQTVRSTRDIGKTENNTARVNLQTSKASQGLVFGRMASV